MARATLARRCGEHLTARESGDVEYHITLDTACELIRTSPR
jgi:hypothetical protein